LLLFQSAVKSTAVILLCEHLNWAYQNVPLLTANSDSRHASSIFLSICCTTASTCTHW